MNRYLGLDRSFLWAMRGLMRLFVRPGVAPADALERLRGRSRPVLYVLGERSLSGFLALEQLCMDSALRRPGKRLAVGGLALERSFPALERRAGVLRKRPDHSIDEIWGAYSRSARK